MHFELGKGSQLSTCTYLSMLHGVESDCAVSWRFFFLVHQGFAFQSSGIEKERREGENFSPKKKKSIH